MFTQADLDLICKLLHDAALLEIDWNQPLAQTSVRFQCLRRATDGAELSDRTVEFGIGGTKIVAIGYDHVLGDRPSTLLLTRKILSSELSDWKLKPSSLDDACFNSAMGIEDIVYAAQSDWFVGNVEKLIDCPIGLIVRISGFQHSIESKGKNVSIVLLIAGQELTLSCNGIPLSLDQWGAEFEAWWVGWKKHWDSKSDSNAKVEEDKFIPAATSSPKQDYSPPDEPAFLIGPTDVPAELLSPLKDYFEGSLSADFVRVAQAYPHLDMPIEKRAEDMRRFVEDCGYGYAREITKWWIEKESAGVSVCGIDNHSGDDEILPNSHEAEWTFGLRRRDGLWKIRNLSGGWPAPHDT